MKPSDKIRGARRLSIILCTLTGVDPFNEKVYPQFLIVLLVMCNYMVMFLNGCYHSLDDPYKFMHALAPISITITLFARIYTLFFRHWLDYDPLMSKIIFGFYEKYENDPRYTKILAKRAADTELYVRLLAFSSFLFFHLPIGTTIVSYVLTGEKVLFLNNFMPYSDPSKTFDFFMNLSLQTILLPMVYCAIIFTDLLFVLYGYHTAAMCDMMCCHIDELAVDLIKLHDERVKMESSDIGTNRELMIQELKARQAHDEKLKNLEQRFIDLIHEHKAYEQFLSDFIYYTGLPCIAQVWCNSVSIGLCILVFFKLSVVLGAAGALIFSSIVLTPCIIGTLISYQNKRLANHILDFPWFDMSRDKQKIFLQFTHAIQATTEFVMPIFGTNIDLEAFTDVLNVSYSYFTFFGTMADT